MSIRPYSASDEDDLVRVWLAATIPGQDFLPPEHWRGLEELVRGHFLDVAETWVAEEGGQLVAFVALLDEVIGGLFTDPAHQGRGHGRALIAHAHSLHDPLRIEVFRKNERAYAIYERCGFVEESSHQDEATSLEVVIMRMDAAPPRGAAPQH